MKIIEIIDVIKKHLYKDWNNKPIEEETTRDRILFGNEQLECTGVVVCIYPSIEVILEAINRNANLIISHESLFWNHGDRTDWLEGDQTFRAKTRLLKKGQICVWRCHDRIHAGLDWKGRREDGIFYGLLSRLNMTEYLIGETGIPTRLQIPPCETQEFVRSLKEKLQIPHFKCIGSMEGKTEKILIANHMFGRDDDVIRCIENEHIDTILAMEMVDYTVGIYINDGFELEKDRRIIAVGHFNMEEPGMEWFAEEYLPTIFPELRISFEKIRDLYKFI